jgi:hypothetical protein
MAFARRLGVVSILGACWFAAVACADDGDRKDTSDDGGEGGDEGGGKAGTPSAGGNSANGGKAGMSSGGKAGSSSAGEGGSGTAGEAGSGSGGDAGSGGMTGGAGGEPTGGGEGGLSSGGAGGEGGAPAEVAKSCVEVCEDDDDCARVDDAPGNCNDVTKICEDPAEVCSEDAHCYPQITGWFGPCESSEECGDPSLVCVDYRGASYCTVMDEPVGTCADYGYGTTTATLHEGGEAEVCVDTEARCFDGKCAFGCATDACDVGEGTCNPVSGRCECQSGAECATGACENNLCTECATDADCAATALGTGLDTCVAGKCGCADVGSCPAGDYPAATNACQ